MLVFETVTAWREWLAVHQATASKIWLITFRRRAGRRSLAYPAAKDEALCFGWVDGPSTTIDPDAFATRWAPRRPSQSWSELDQVRVRRLIESRRMTPAGIAVMPPRLLARLGLPTQRTR
jgi:uncharacterized protein YdeI (YjbR/CyaY-like superfamily)